MSQKWRTILQLLLILVIVGLIIWLMDFLGAFKSASGDSQLVFRVESTGGYANITLNTDQKQLYKGQNVTTPWEKTFTLPSGTTVYLTASNPTQYGTLTCSIRLARTVWKTASTNAPKDGVACAGIIP